MKLRGYHVVLPDAADERSAVVGGRGDHLRVVGNDVVAVNEVDAAANR